MGSPSKISLNVVCHTATPIKQLFLGSKDMCKPDICDPNESCINATSYFFWKPGYICKCKSGYIEDHDDCDKTENCISKAKCIGK